jgi:hypothetical protein
MGMKVQAQDERGSVLVHFLDIRNRLVGAIECVYESDRERYESWVMLRYIDRYGNTVVNQLQLKPLIAELDVLSTLFDSDAETAGIIRTIRGMAQYCKARVHTYLWFFGD